MAKKDTESGSPTVLAAEEVTTLDYVDPQDFYFVDLQFGSKASWRDWQGQPRKVAPNANGGFDYTHNPKIIPNIGALSGEIVNGLISGHNDWLKRHKRHREKDYTGQLDRQILVLDIRQTDTIPKESSAAGGMVPLKAVEAMIAAAVKEQISALTGQ